MRGPRVRRTRIDGDARHTPIVHQLEAVVALGETQHRLVQLSVRVADDPANVLLAVHAPPHHFEPEQVAVEGDRPVEVGDVEAAVVRPDDAQAPSPSGTRKLRRNSQTTTWSWFRPTVSMVTTPVPGRERDRRASTTVLSP